MDTLTHTVIGACLGEAIAGKRIGRRAMLIGAVANNLPDIDVLANLWANETEALIIHRGITHSILVNSLLTVLLATLSRRYLSDGLSLKRWSLLWGSGLFLHIVLDAFTAYGTGWFEPFSDHRVTFNTIFILDPVFTLPVLISGIALLLIRKNSERRLKWARTGLLISGAYLVLICINKTMVNRAAESSFAREHIHPDSYFSTPTPLNNFLWYIVARTDSTYRIGYYSIFDKDKWIEYETVRRNDHLLQYPCDPGQVNNLRRFSQGYYCAHLENDTVVFSDMRFGQLGGWYKPHAPFVFNFKMALNCSNKTALQKGRFEAFSSETTIQLFKRIRGKR